MDVKPLRYPEPIFEVALECEKLYTKQIARLNTDSRTNDAAILSELHQRFAAWAAFVGVFAEYGLSLDRRVRHYIGVQEQLLRLLYIMERNLASVYEARDIPEATQVESLDELQAPNFNVESLEAIFEAVDRLNHIGSAIRNSSITSHVVKSRSFSETFDFASFDGFAYLALKSMYSLASEELLELLTSSMTDTYALFLYRKSGYEKTISEDTVHVYISPLDLGTQASQQNIDLSDMIINSPLQVSKANPLSEPTTVGSQEGKARHRAANSFMKRATGSILINQANYSPPEKGNMCQWCFDPTLPMEVYDNKEEWQQHVNEDHERYVCLLNKCPELPRFASSRQWLDHMLRTHGQDWYRKAYAPSSWLCFLCDDSVVTFSNSAELASHFTDKHPNRFKPQEIKAVARQSRVRSLRSKDECLLCCLATKTQEDELLEKKRQDGKDALVLQKSMMGDNAEQSQLTDELVGSHVAKHLQTIMALTLRMISIDVAMGVTQDEKSVEDSKDDHLSRARSTLSREDEAIETSEDIIYLEESDIEPKDGLPPDLEIPDCNEEEPWKTMDTSFEEAKKTTDLCLLSLDGGGVRILSTLLILKQLMELLDRENPPKPCDRFDMIGATGTGGLVAIMLGRLKMSIDECIDAYLTLIPQIFEKKRYRVQSSFKIQSRFDSKLLEKAIKEVIIRCGLPEDSLFKDKSMDICKVLVCVTDMESNQTMCLPSYESPSVSSKMFENIKIWEACCATLASTTFFDPITISYDGHTQRFMDGALAANNPVWEVWSQAKLLWRPQMLQGKIKCLISICTGVRPSKTFGRNISDIHRALAATTVEIEQTTAEAFRRKNLNLVERGQYYRFNIGEGLEMIGTEEWQNHAEIAAVTRDYVGSHLIVEHMRECARRINRRDELAIQSRSNLNSVLKVSRFIGRHHELAKIHEGLFPAQQTQRQKIFVLYGLGGIGKTQLVVEYASRHQYGFSSIFWLDGRSSDSVVQSIASCVKLIPNDQISQASKKYVAGDPVDINMVVRDVLGWLAKPDNLDWLLIFDNIEKGYNSHSSDPDPDAYDVMQYIPPVDHGSILITTRLARLNQIGESLQLDCLISDQAEELFRSLSCEDDNSDADHLLDLLGCLPLAIAEAAAFIRVNYINFKNYSDLYEQDWEGLMRLDEVRLPDYPGRNVLTTWISSFKWIQNHDIAAANLLLLWAFIDPDDLWYGMFADACEKSVEVASILSESIFGVQVVKKLDFIKHIRALRDYSFLTSYKDESYSIHRVVQKWAYYYQSAESREKLARLAVILVGYAVPTKSSKDYLTMQRRLLPHVRACSTWIDKNLIKQSSHTDRTVPLFYEAIARLGCLLLDQGQLEEANKVLKLAMQGCMETLGGQHPATMHIYGRLGDIYMEQGNFADAYEMFQVKLELAQKAYGPKNLETLSAGTSLGITCIEQGKLYQAEELLEKALRSCETLLAGDDFATLDIVNNLGVLLYRQGRVAEANMMYTRVLQQKEKVVGRDHVSTLDTLGNLAQLYADRDQLDEAEDMYQRVIKGYENALGPSVKSIDPMIDLAALWNRQSKLSEAIELFTRALDLCQRFLGPNHPKATRLQEDIESMGRDTETPLKEKSNPIETASKKDRPVSTAQGESSTSGEKDPAPKSRRRRLRDALRFK